MKKYVKPIMSAEVFEVNECIAACYDYTVTLQCAIPGQYANKVNDGSRAHDNHGICANTARFDVSGNKGFEVTYGKINTLRPISNIVIGESCTNSSTFSKDIGTHSGDMTDGYYKATWTSTDLENGTGSYDHYGLAYVSSAYSDPTRPNHS